MLALLSPCAFYTPPPTCKSSPPSRKSTDLCFHTACSGSHGFPFPSLSGNYLFLQLSWVPPLPSATLGLLLLLLVETLIFRSLLPREGTSAFLRTLFHTSFRHPLSDFPFSFPNPMALSLPFPDTLHLSPAPPLGLLNKRYLSLPIARPVLSSEF
jgi:hypothetical protein